MSKAGNLILFQNQGKGIVPLFVLKQSVHIPKRPYMAPALREKSKWIIGQLKKSLSEAIKK